MVETLVKLVGEFSSEYKNAKQDKDLVDFSDLEHYALNILVEEDSKGNYIPTDTAGEMAADFYEVMIDEYQDSNLVQEIILNAVAGRGENIPNVFMVGDVKQSIYKFRLARPELFLEKYNTYVSADEEGDSKKIVLSKNFRSRYQVLDFCNMVFKQIMTKNLGGISYDAENKEIVISPKLTEELKGETLALENIAVTKDMILSLYIEGGKANCKVSGDGVKVRVFL